MAVSGIGKIAGKAAGSAAGALGEIMGSGVYPETEYGLAAYLYERVLQTEKTAEARDRDYHLELMRQCLAAVRR